MAVGSRSSSLLTVVLPLAVFFASCHSLAITGSPNKWTKSIPNIKSAMAGYNVYDADSFSKPDPGIRNQIFSPLLNSDLETGKVQYNAFVGTSNENVYCDKAFAGVTIQNVQEYNQVRTFSYNHTEKSMFHSSSESYQQQSVQNFFSATNGELVIAKASCVAYSVGIYYNEKPTFTDGFVDAMRTLNKEAVKNGPKNNETFISFVNDFGTHFMRHTDLGAKLFYVRSFYQKTSSQQETDQRNDCVSEEAGFTMNLDAVLKVVETGVKIAETAAMFVAKGNPTSSKVGKKESTSKCIGMNSNSEEMNHAAAEIKAEIIIGALPSSTFETWAPEVLEHPVPVSFELEKISHLFKSEWIDNIPVDPLEPSGQTLNGTAMTKYFDEKLASYCIILYGAECSSLTGCGYNDNCPRDTVCYNDDSKLGFKCEQLTPNYGGIVIAGGHQDANSEYLESFGAAMYPQPSPAPSAHASITAVRSRLYLCGQYDSESQISCYSTNVDGSESWSFKFGIDLLGGLSMTRHTAVAVSTHIWFVFQDLIYDYDTESKGVTQFSTPFQTHITESEIHCAVSNSSHSFVIGVGDDYTEIWVNSKANSPESWQKVQTFDEPRTNFGCVWNESKIYVSGGQSFDGLSSSDGNDTTTTTITTTSTTTLAPLLTLNSVVTLNSMTYALVKAEPLLTSRHSHSMFILDKNPAVVGGDNAGGDRLASVDMFDGTSWKADNRKIGSARDSFGLAQLLL